MPRFLIGVIVVGWALAWLYIPLARSLRWLP